MGGPPVLNLIEVASILRCLDALVDPDELCVFSAPVGQKFRDFGGLEAADSEPGGGDGKEGLRTLFVGGDVAGVVRDVAQCGQTVHGHREQSASDLRHRACRVLVKVGLLGKAQDRPKAGRPPRLASRGKQKRLARGQRRIDDAFGFALDQTMQLRRSFRDESMFDTLLLKREDLAVGERVKATKLLPDAGDDDVAINLVVVPVEEPFGDLVELAKRDEPGGKAPETAQGVELAAKVSNSQRTRMTAIARARVSAVSLWNLSRTSDLNA